MKKTLLFLLLPALFVASQLPAQTELLAQVDPAGPGDDLPIEDTEYESPDGKVFVNESGDVVYEPVAEEDPTGTWTQELWAFIKLHWAGLALGLLAFIEVIVRLTPTEKDNAWFNWVKGLLDAIIPNRSKYGGTHSR